MLEVVFIVIVPVELFVTVEVLSTEIPTKLAPVFPSILPEFITFDSFVAKIPAEPAPDISIPFATVPLFVTLDFLPIIPTDFIPVILINPLLNTSDCALACPLSLFANIPADSSWATSIVPVFSVVIFLVLPLAIKEYIPADFPSPSARISIVPSFFETFAAVASFVIFAYIPADASLFTVILELFPEFVRSEFSPYIPADETPPKVICLEFIKVEPRTPNIPTAFLLFIVIVPMLFPFAAFA